MIVEALLALHLFSGHGLDRQAPRTVSHPGGWTLTVQRDRFTGALRCDLRRGHARAEKGWVTFDLGRYVDTMLADVRLDNGPARNVRELPHPFPDPNQDAQDEITNPSGGRVVLAQADVVQARTAWIRPAQNRSVRRFDVGGLGQALDAARAAGCP